MGKQQYAGYHGWRSEVLAQFLLSDICFTVPVPTKSDVGVDFFCTLFDKKSGENKDPNSYLVPRSTFALQVKSKDNEIVLSADNFNYIQGLENPYFLAIVDKNAGKVDIYSCQQFPHLSLKYGSLSQEAQGKKFQITLKPIHDYTKTNFEENLNKLIGDDIKFSELLDKRDDLITERITRKGEEIINLKLEIGPKVLTLENGKEPDGELPTFVNLDYFNFYNRKHYIPYQLMAFYNGEKKLNYLDINYYHIKNYDNAVFLHLAPRLAMLLKHHFELENKDLSTDTQLSTSKEKLKYLLESDDIKKLIELIIEKSKQQNNLSGPDLALQKIWMEQLNSLLTNQKSK